MSYARFAVYFVPPPGALADFGAAWLGWDVARGEAARQPDVPGLAEITSAPRKYGFHGTLKPPFRLAGGRNAAGLAAAAGALAEATVPARCAGLGLARIGRFLALTPLGDGAEISRLAASLVAGLDAFRAPPGPDELARRRSVGLTAGQEALLARWGYPYVMEEFRFHLTLTGPLPETGLSHWEDILRARLPPLPAPFIVDEVALVGERADGRFDLLHRYALTG